MTSPPATPRPSFFSQLRDASVRAFGARVGARDELRTAPGPRGVPVLGMLPALRTDPLATLTEAAREFGDVVRLPVGPFAFFLLNHPDHIRHVLQEKNHNYPKSANYDELKLIVGNGLLTSEGEHWLRQRRLVQPAFHKQRIAALAETMTRATGEMLARWSRTSGEVDIAAEMMRLTLKIVGLTLFGADLEGDAGDVGRAVDHVIHFANERIDSFIRPPLSVPTPRNLRARREIAALDRVVYRIIEARRREGGDRGDLLSMLLLAHDERSQTGMTDAQLRDEIMTLVLAGHETTAVALSWTLYLLSQHPTVERKLRAEIESVLGDRTPGFDDIAKLRYTNMVIQESMRLYPPAWAIERQAIATDEIGGFEIPAGSMVLICSYAMHRHPRYWENPEGFDPDRFAVDQSGDRPRGAYIPFGAGPRICIGNQFALTEIALVLAMITQRFRLDLVPGAKVEPDPVVTLRPRTGVPMTLHARG